MSYRQPFSGEYPITQYYGETITSSFHTGIDYGCPLNTPILASEDGVIRFSEYDRTGYGYCVIIEHDISHATLYGHLSSLKYLSTGIAVKQGDVIGYSGNSGYSTGPHLHFEARNKWNDFRTHFDPMELQLTCVDDSISGNLVENSVSDELKPGPVFIIAQCGAYAHNEDFTSKQALPYGAELTFTGNTKEKNGLTFCECTIWIAANDGETQILSPKTV